MEPVVGEVRGEGGGRELGFVVVELRHGKEAGPVGLLVVAVDPKILLYDRVEALRLAIRLGMESGRPVGVDAQEFRESAPLVRGEDRIAIADGVGRQAVKPDDVLNE